MHTRERAFSRLLSVTCHDFCKLFKCPTKKKTIYRPLDNIKEARVKEREEKRARKAVDA
jgi:hypothetical protein